MQQTALAGIFFLLVLSGCTQLPALSVSPAEQLQSIELRYIGRGTIAPDNVQDIDLMAKELQALRGKSPANVQEQIDIRLHILSFSRHYLGAQQSKVKISPIKGGCTEQDPLKATINELRTALDLRQGIVQELQTFAANNPNAGQTTSISLADFQEFSNTVQAEHDEMLAFYTTACTQ